MRLRSLFSGYARCGRGCRRPAGTARGGFTLLEVLLAVAVLSLVSTTVALILHVGVETWRTATEMGEETQDGDAIMEQVVMALRSAYYPSVDSPSYEYGFTLEDDGEEEEALDVISWVKIGGSLVGENNPWAGSAHRVKLRVIDSDEYEGPGLYVYAWQIVGQDKDFDPDEDVEPILLSDQVVALDCRIQDPEKVVNVGEPYEWMDEWTASNRIPEHVLLTLYLKPRGSQKEPNALQRMVDFPMSALSWNPSSFSEEGGRGGSSRGPGGGAGTGATGGTGAPGGGAPGGVGIGGAGFGGNRGNRGNTSGGTGLGGNRGGGTGGSGVSRPNRGSGTGGSGSSPGRRPGGNTPAGNSGGGGFNIGFGGRP